MADSGTILTFVTDYSDEPLCLSEEIAVIVRGMCADIDGMRKGVITVGVTDGKVITVAVNKEYRVGKELERPRV